MSLPIGAALARKIKREEKNDIKDRLTISVDKHLLDWIDGKISERIFANRSHGFEFIIQQKINEAKK